MTTYDWTNHLSSWSQTVLTSQLARHVPSGIIRNGWLGYPPADAKTILQAEQRLECNLPPSYKEFLAVSNGWGLYVAGMKRLLPVEQVMWSKLGRRPALVLSETEGGHAIMLDATVVNAVGEWQALRVGEDDTQQQVYPNFWELMQGWYRQLKSMLADTGERTALTLEALNAAIDYIYQQVAMMERMFAQRNMPPERLARAQKSVMLLNLMTSRLESLRGYGNDLTRLTHGVQMALRESEQASFHQGNEEFLQTLAHCRSLLG